MNGRQWIAAVAVMLLVAMVSIGGDGTASAVPFVRLRQFSIPVFVPILLAAVLGVAVALGIRAKDQNAQSYMSAMSLVPLPATILLAALFLFAYRSGLAAGQAAVGLLLGVLAMLAALRAFDRMTKGDAIGLESHWGGLGGGSSGWRLSPAAGLAALALAFTGASLALVVVDPSKADDNEVQTSGDTPPKEGSGKDAAGTDENAEGSAEPPENAAADSGEGGGSERAAPNAPDDAGKEAAG